MSYLQRIKENNNYIEEDKIPFLIDNKRVGQIRKEYLEYILSSDTFVLKDKILTLKESLKSFDERSYGIKAIFINKT